MNIKFTIHKTNQAIRNNIVAKKTTEHVLFLHKNITKLVVFFWPNMGNYFSLRYNPFGHVHFFNVGVFVLVVQEMSWEVVMNCRFVHKGKVLIY